MKMGVAILDIVAGLYATIAVLAALRDRDLSSRGRDLTSRAVRGEHRRPGRSGSELPAQRAGPRGYGQRHPSVVPLPGLRGSDGQFVVAGRNDKVFCAICVAIGRLNLASDPR